MVPMKSEHEEEEHNQRKGRRRQRIIIGSEQICVNHKKKM